MFEFMCRHELEERARTPTEIIYICRGGCGRLTRVEVSCAHEWHPIERAVAAPLFGTINAEMLLDYGEDGKEILKKLCGSIDVLFECQCCHVLFRSRLLGQPPTEQA